MWGWRIHSSIFGCIFKRPDLIHFHGAADSEMQKLGLGILVQELGEELRVTLALR